MSDRLKIIANKIRKNALRAIFAAKSGHPGGSLSITEIITSLYFKELQPQPYDANDPERDILILSKGHAVPSLYSCWVELGLIDKEELLTLRKFGSRLQGHPSVRHTPWCETSTGSLGQGLSVAIGMALGFKLIDSSRRVYCIVGDGDMHEGMSVEAARFASHYELNNLCVIWDRNGLQSDRHSIDFIKAPLLEYRAYGWYAEACDGHDFRNLKALFDFARFKSSKPVLIKAMTKKGKGVSFMESDLDGMHGSVELSEDELSRALKEL